MSDDLKNGIEQVERQLTDATAELTAAQAAFTEASRKFAMTGRGEADVEQSAKAVTRAEARLRGFTVELDTRGKQLAEAERAEQQRAEEQARAEHFGSLRDAAQRLNSEVDFALGLAEHLAESLGKIEELTDETLTHTRFGAASEARTICERARVKLGSGNYEHVNRMLQHQGYHPTHSTMGSLQILVRPLRLEKPEQAEYPQPKPISPPLPR